MRNRGLPGVMIYQVTPDGPAAKAGLQPLRRKQLGDIITAVDGKAVQTIDDLDAALDSHSIGDTVTLSILRGGPNGEKKDVKVTLQGEGARNRQPLYQPESASEGCAAIPSLALRAGRAARRGFLLPRSRSVSTIKELSRPRPEGCRRVLE